jgi:hypothetical protein
MTGANPVAVLPRQRLSAAHKSGASIADDNARAALAVIRSIGHTQ